MAKQDPTPQQRDAINFNGNLIVSASAGAGKTTVLSKRVARLVSEDVPIDSMLILTFTRAAAAEMKSRIAKRLSDAAKHAAGDRAAYYRKQAAAVANAHISTIDAFCAKIVFRHFFRVGLTPSVRTLDALESDMLKAESRNAALDAIAAENAAQYGELILAFEEEKNLDEAIKNFAFFLSSLPEPDEWLAQQERATDDPNAMQAQAQYAFQKGKDILRQQIEAVQYEADQLPRDCVKVLAVIDHILSHLRGALLANTRESFAEALSALTGKRLILSFPEEIPEEDRKPLKDAKSDLMELCREQAALHATSIADLFEADRPAAPILKAFFALIRRYLALYTEAKRAKNAVDFNDLEHMAIEILKDDEIAAEYRDRFQTIIVDEYQDSNRLQEAILNRIARPGKLFFVGDVKQSIYRFRMAEPSLFLEKCETFCGEYGKRIDLGDNFRSGRAVIDAVNRVFGTIMKKPIAGIEYDARASLKQGNPSVPDGKAELHLFARENDSDDEETLEDAEAEARFAARVIKARMKEPVSEEGVLRACRHSDFVVLMRKKENILVWAQTLAEEGVPCYAESVGGYFDAIEVKLVMSLLSVLDNRRQDIPLAAVLRSPLFGFSDALLTRLRADSKKEDLIDTLLRARDTEPEVGAFFAAIERYRALSHRMPLSELIELILDETHYRELVGTLTGGEQRIANLEALIRAAGACEASGVIGVHGFVHYMKSAQETKSFGAASTVTADVVRIMTVHASKGLEAPFVFYAGLGGQFNNKEKSKPLLAEGTLGVGLKYTDEFGVPCETLAHRNISSAVDDAAWAEELRIMYVGMTRAKQELYLLGSLINMQEKLDGLRPPMMQSIRKCRSALDLMLLSLNGYLAPVQHRKSEFTGSKTRPATEEALRPSAEEREALRAQFDWRYPHPVLDTLPDKTSVTGLSRTEEPDFNEPAFETGCDVLSEGSAVHHILECLPLSDAAKRAAYLRELPGVSPFHAEAIRTFAASPLFLRMAASKRVEREWSFLCPTPARELLPETDSDETILLQGVIDACFLEDGAWVLLDYKTDRVTGDPHEYAKKHTRQVALYAAALERLSGIPVRERYIVLLGANTEVAV